MKIEKKNNDHNIEDFVEWQDKQYDPGYYLGGKIPRNLQHSKKTKMIGISLIGIGLMTLILLVFSIINDFQSDESLLPIECVLLFIQIFGFGLFSLLMIVNGIRKIMSGVKKHHS